MFRPIRRVIVVLLAFILPTIFRYIASAQESPSPEPVSVSDAVPADPSISFFLSPNKLVHTQLAERLLNTPQWSIFFTRHLSKLDSRLLSDPRSPLAEVFANVFHSSPSFQEPMDLFFFNLQGVWGNLVLDESGSLRPGSPALIYATDFLPDSILLLTTAALEQIGYVEDRGRVTLPRRFALSESDRTLFLDWVSPLPDDQGKSLFVLSTSEDPLENVKKKFPQSKELSGALSRSDPLFLLIGTQQPTLRRLADTLAARPEESTARAFAPALSSIADNVQAVQLTAQEVSGVTTVVITFVCSQNESSTELQNLFRQIRDVYTKWARERDTLTETQALWLELLTSTEPVCEDNRLFLFLKLDSSEIFEKLKECLASGEEAD